MNRKYNILYTSSYSTMQGGGQRSMYLLVKYLDKSRYTPFLAIPEDGELAAKIRELGTKVFVFPFPRIRSLNVFKVILTLVRLVRRIKENSIDLVHVDAPREALYAGIAGTLLGIPVVCHLRVSDSEIWLDKILYRLADCFIAVSHSVARRFSSIDSRDKVHVVYNGVELDAYSMHPGRNESPCLKIGYFGRIDRKKGIDTLINAMKLLKEDTELLIMGKGDEEYLSVLREMAEGTNAVFKEYKADIIEEMSLVDVIVLPSYGEGLSRVIIESMALGKVIIASGLPENREALGGQLKRFVFSVGKTEKLTEILKDIIENRNILDENKNALRRRAEECFDIRKNTRQVEAVYDKLVRY